MYDVASHIGAVDWLRWIGAVKPLDNLRRRMQAVTLWEILWADEYWQRLGSWTPPSLSRPSSGSVSIQGHPL